MRGMSLDQPLELLIPPTGALFPEELCSGPANAARIATIPARPHICVQGALAKSGVSERPHVESQRHAARVLDPLHRGEGGRKRITADHQLHVRRILFPSVLLELEFEEALAGLEADRRRVLSDLLREVYDRHHHCYGGDDLRQLRGVLKS